jgi:formylglycine-generating enzyme required for sulfatase activity/serine/threonine protein kinase
MAGSESADPTGRALGPGAIVAGRFRLAERLGKGGFGTVFRAYDQELHEDVALKVLNPEVAREEEARARFFKEVKLARAFVHKYSVQLFEFGRDPERDALFFTMRLVSGPTLRKVLEQERALDPARAARIGVQVLEALEEAHGAGIVHRDLKPDNLILTTNSKGAEEVRVLDFGIAKAISQARQEMARATITGTTVGTLAYMSPEQAQGKKLDGRSDLYSVGAILYECLAGRRPIEADPDAEDETQSLIFNLAVKPPADLGVVAPSVPSSLGAVVLAALAKRPEDRHPDARSFRDALVRACEQAGLPVSVDGGSRLLSGSGAPLSPASAVAASAAARGPALTATGLPTGGFPVDAAPTAAASTLTSAPTPGSMARAASSAPSSSVAPPASSARLLLPLLALVAFAGLAALAAALVRQGSTTVVWRVPPPAPGPAVVPVAPPPAPVPPAAVTTARADDHAPIVHPPEDGPPEVALDPIGAWQGRELAVSARVKSARPARARFRLAGDEAATSPVETLVRDGRASATLTWTGGAFRSLEVVVAVEDERGRAAEARRPALVREPLSVTIESPEAGLESHGEPVQVQARVDGTTEITAASVAVNPGDAGEETRPAEVRPADRVVRATVDLPDADGPVVLEVRVQDWLGNVGQARVTVNRGHTGPALPRGLRLGPTVPLASGRSIQVFLWRLPRSAGDLELVAVPEGDFSMGSEAVDALDNEKPKHAHPMTHSYWIGRFDVTRAQYRAFCKDSGHAEPERASFDDHLGVSADQHPVVKVSWDDAKAFCAWAGLVLPTEAEWEKAARGTDGRTFPWGGDVWDPAKANFLDASCPGDKITVGHKTLDEWAAPWGGRDKAHSDGFPYTSPVGSFAQGASPYGALDMAGNVWQWCEDAYEASYKRFAGGDFSPAPASETRVSRGGSWSNPPQSCRTSSRHGGPAGSHHEFVGFRPLLRHPG